MTWKVGQQVVINRRTVVTIERVTKAGRVTADGKVFDAEGREWGSRFGGHRLEPFTPEIEAEMAFSERSRKAFHEAYNLTDDTVQWLRKSFSSWGNRVAEINDVERAEKLILVLRDVMGDILNG